MRASCTLSSLSMNQCGTRSTLLCHQLIPLGDKKAATAPHIISCLYQVQRQDRAGRVFSFILPPLTSSADFFSGLENSQPLVVREAGKVGIWHLQPLLWMVDWFQKKKTTGGECPLVGSQECCHLVFTVVIIVSWKCNHTNYWLWNLVFYCLFTPHGGFYRLSWLQKESPISRFIVHTQILLHGNYKRHKGESREATYCQQQPLRTDNLGYMVRKATCGQMVSKETWLGLGFGIGECGKSCFDYLKSQY